jgi:protein-S-isoprenylcysteine O-methyltransferase Ste14
MWLVAASLFHVGLPWFLSTLYVRLVWHDGSPGVWNELGLLPVLAGFGLLAWALALHFATAKQGWTLDLAPSYMVVSGPYRWTRNPMYLAAFAIWLGWAIFYGSLPIAAGFLVLSIFIIFFQVPAEEHALRERFGDGYLRYTESVPRWVPAFRFSGSARKEGG